MNPQAPESAALEFPVHSLNDEWDQTGVDPNPNFPLTRYHLIGIIPACAGLALAACGGTNQVGVETTQLPLVPTITPGPDSQMTPEKVIEIGEWVASIWSAMGAAIFLGGSNGFWAYKGWKGSIANAEQMVGFFSKQAGELEDRLRQKLDSGGVGIMAVLARQNQNQEGGRDFDSVKGDFAKMDQLQSQVKYFEGVTKTPRRRIIWDIIKESLEAFVTTMFIYQAVPHAGLNFLTKWATIGGVDGFLASVELGVTLTMAGGGIVIAWKKQTDRQQS